MNNKPVQKKISKAIFVHEEISKENIEATKISAPVSVGKVELPERKPFVRRDKEKLPNDKKPLLFRNFPIAQWDLHIRTAKEANKIIGEMSVTISKKAYVNGKIDEAFGSIWYTCGTKDFRDKFRRGLEVAVNGIGMRQLSKNEIKRISSDVCFYILFIDPHCNTDLVECIKTEDHGKGDSLQYFVYDEKRDHFYTLSYSEMKDNGTGMIDEEEYFVFVSDQVENI